MTSDEMPKGIWARAKWAARHTPDNRNRSVDLYRAIAISFVIFGHWLLVAAVDRGNGLDLTIILAEQPWTQYATWVAQVMPVFFFVGGFSNAISWQSAGRDPEKARIWAATRLTRLLLPTVPLVLVWAVIAILGAQVFNLTPDQIVLFTQAALVPIWFLAVYIIITVAVPVSWWLWERLGLASVALLTLAAIAVDTIAFSFGQDWLRWSNYGFVWLAVHQLGYAWQTGKLSQGRALALLVLGVVWLTLLLVVFDYPISMVSVPGEEVSNTLPPTVAMLAIGCIQIGLVLLVERAANAWLQREAPWAAVIVLNQMIMTVYLWHMTALIIAVGAAYGLGSIGLTADPGTSDWWVMRPLWIAIFIVILIPFVLIFMRFEGASKAPSDKLPGGWVATFGALVTCGGLVMMALAGLGADNALGVNWIALAMVVLGVGLGTRRLPGT